MNFSDNKTRTWDLSLCANKGNGGDLASVSQFEECWSNPAFVDDLETLRIFTYGNSYNEQLSPLYTELSVKSKNISVNYYFTSGCSSSSFVFWQVSSNTPQKDLCSKNFTAYLSFVKREGREGDIFIIANSHTINAGESVHVLFDSRNPRKKFNHVDYLHLVSKEYNEIGAILSKKKINLFITTDVPHILGDPLLCDEWFSRYHDKCSKKINSLTASITNIRTW